MNLLKKLSIILISCVISIFAYSQEYKTALIYEAHGPIKEIRTKSENKLAKGKVKFMPNGQEKTEFMTFDDKGYPIGYGMNVGNMFSKLSIAYDSLKNISSMTYESNIVGNKCKIEVCNEYENQRLASRKIHMTSPKKEGIIISEFSNEIYDEYGNWTERTVKERGINENGDIGKELIYVETRIYKYYP